MVEPQEEEEEPYDSWVTSSIRTLMVSVGGAGTSFATVSPRVFAPSVLSFSIDAKASLLSHNLRGTGPLHRLSRKQGGG